MIPGLCPPAAPPSPTLNEVEDSEEVVFGKQEMQMEQPNAMSLTIRKKSSFVWKEMGFTECSESCLGGEFSALRSRKSRLSKFPPLLSMLPESNFANWTGLGAGLQCPSYKYVSFTRDKIGC